MQFYLNNSIIIYSYKIVKLQPEFNLHNLTFVFKYVILFYSFINITPKNCQLTTQNDTGGKITMKTEIEFSNTANDAVLVGENYFATVLSSCNWGAFCRIDCIPQAIVLVHCTEWSVCRFQDLRHVAKRDMHLEVKILSKFERNGQIFVTASRKDAFTRIGVSPKRGDVIPVILNSPVETGDGFYCEVTPNKSGIIDYPSQKTFNYSEGLTVWAYVKEVAEKGYRLNPYGHYQQKTN